MGTDIHAAIEYLDGGKWCAYVAANRNYGKYADEPLLSASIDIHRDYDLFAILGNVRNGKGFGGCPTGQGFDFISDSRGVPEDISPEARAALSDEHSASWVTLGEILGFDWTKTSVKYGVLSSVEFEKWDRMREWQSAPSSYSGDVMGGQTRKISEDEMREYIKSVIGVSPDRSAAITRLDPNLYSRVQWTESYAKAGVQLWTTALPVMLKLGSQYGINNVRLVMDFDS